MVVVRWAGDFNVDFLAAAEGTVGSSVNLVAERVVSSIVVVVTHLVTCWSWRINSSFDADFFLVVRLGTSTIFTLSDVDLATGIINVDLYVVVTILMMVVTTVNRNLYVNFNVSVVVVTMSWDLYVNLYVSTVTMLMIWKLDVDFGFSDLTVWSTIAARTAVSIFLSSELDLLLDEMIPSRRIETFPSDALLLSLGETEFSLDVSFGSGCVILRGVAVAIRRRKDAERDRDSGVKVQVVCLE